MHRARTTMVTFSLSAVLLLVADGGQTEQLMETHPAMMDFSKALLGVEKGLAAGDAEVMARHALVLKETTEKLADLQPQVNVGGEREFDMYRDQIGRLATDLFTRVETHQLAEIPQVVRQIRHTCISCHVKFRAANDQYDLFPNAKNAITGAVRIFKTDGEERTKRADVLVFLERVTAVASSPPSKNPVISQRDRHFVPRILPVVKGTTVELPNDDRIFHNVFSLSKTQPFDLDVYPPGQSKSVKFERPGWVKIYCNIHPQMIAHVLVLDNPFFALTDEQGVFVIADVPDGTYVLRTWHEFGGALRQQIDISGVVLQRYDLEVREDSKFVRHKNKFGKSYGERY